MAISETNYLHVRRQVKVDKTMIHHYNVFRFNNPIRMLFVDIRVCFAYLISGPCSPTSATSKIFWLIHWLTT